MQNAVETIATWFYLGRMPKAPGTWGTLGAVPLVLLLSLLGEFGYLVGTLVVTLMAIFISTFYVNATGKEDPKEVVIDEVAGFCVAMAWLPVTWQSFVAAFVIFRLLDVLKPPPINWLDQKIKGGIGVVADDLMAGILTNIALQIVFVQTSWLGYQLVS